jgi:hypothetical protein
MNEIEPRGTVRPLNMPGMSDENLYRRIEHG